MRYSITGQIILTLFVLTGCGTATKNIGEALESGPTNDVAVVFVEPHKPIVQEIYGNYGNTGGFLGELIETSINQARFDSAQAEVKPFIDALEGKTPYREIFSSIKEIETPLEWGSISEYHYLEYSDNFNFDRFVTDNIKADMLLIVEPQIQFPQRHEVLEATAKLSVLKRDDIGSPLYSNYVSYQSEIHDVYKDVERTPEFERKLSQIQTYHNEALSKNDGLFQQRHDQVCQAITKLDDETVTLGKANPDGRRWLKNQGDVIHTFIDQSAAALPHLIFVELNDRDNRLEHKPVPVSIFSRVGYGFGSSAKVEPGYELYNDGKRHIVRTYRGDDKDVLWSKKIEYPILSKRARWQPSESLLDEDNQNADITQ